MLSLATPPLAPDGAIWAADQQICCVRRRTRCCQAQRFFFFRWMFTRIGATIATRSSLIGMVRHGARPARRGNERMLRSPLQPDGNCPVAMHHSDAWRIGACMASPPRSRSLALNGEIGVEPSPVAAQRHVLLKANLGHLQRSHLCRSGGMPGARPTGPRPLRRPPLASLLFVTCIVWHKFSGTRSSGWRFLRKDDAEQHQMPAHALLFRCITSHHQRVGVLADQATQLLDVFRRMDSGAAARSPAG